MRTDLDTFHWELIEFALTWAPYGGASDEHARPRFTIAGQALGARFTDIVRGLADPYRAELTEHQRHLNLRARRVLPAEPPRAAAASEIGLSPHDGGWVMCRGHWHWQPTAHGEAPGIEVRSGMEPESTFVTALRPSGRPGPRSSVASNATPWHDRGLHVSGSRAIRDTKA